METENIIAIALKKRTKNFQLFEDYKTRKKCLVHTSELCNSRFSLWNPLTADSAKFDQNGILPGQAIVIKPDHEKNGIIYGHVCYNGIANISGKDSTEENKMCNLGIENNKALNKYYGLQIRTVDSCIKDASFKGKCRGESDGQNGYTAASLITDPREIESVEFKLEVYTKEQRWAVYKSIVAMTKYGGHVFGGVEDLPDNDGHIVVRGLQDSLKKYSSIDRLEASLRNEFSLLTSSLVDMNFNWYRTADNKVYVDIEVKPSPVPVLLDDCCFVRFGNITKQLHGSQLLRYLENYFKKSA